MKLIGSTKSKIKKEVTEVLLIHCNVVNKMGNSTVTELLLERIFFNLHSIAEHILPENLIIIKILLQVMKLIQFQEKN